jgi:hypothetical protein
MVKNNNNKKTEREREPDVQSDDAWHEMGEKKERKKKRKTTAPRIPAWSPTVVLTGRYFG